MSIAKTLPEQRLPTAPPVIPVPARLARRPVERGFVVPWFVAEIDGHHDFRIVEPRRIVEAVRENRCWICGQQNGRFLVFTVGPMCAINRVSSEPPAHRECAEYAARVCPFLTQRQVRRRDTGLPEHVGHAAGIPILRQPGVALLWVTRSYRVERAPGGVLIRMGDPVETVWYREGRAATRAEVDASIESGYPLLHAEAEKDGPEAVALLEQMRAAIAPLLPPAEAVLPDFSAGTGSL